MQSVLFLLAAASVGALAAAVASSHEDQLRGPSEMELSDLERRSGSLLRRYVAVECRDAVETGLAWVETTTRFGRETSRSETPYWALPCGERLMLVQADRRPSGRVEGTLLPLDRELASMLDREARAKLLPVILREGDPRPATWAGIAFLGLGSVVLCLLGLRMCRRAADPKRHPAVRRFADTGDIEGHSEAVERELADPDAIRFRGRILTRSYLVDGRIGRFELRRLVDLVWSYKRSTRHRWNFIPTGSTHAPVLCFSDGSELVLAGRRSTGRAASESVVDSLLAAIGDRAPAAFHGYHEDLERAWRTGRQELVEEVERRRVGAAAAASG